MEKSGAHITVLLVDDHQMVVESFNRLLSATPDIEVVGLAGNARDGLAAAIDTRPDVVVVDYKLPDTDGGTAASQIRTSLPDVRVIMLTGSSDPAALRAAFAAGCVGYIEKTSALDRLPAAIRSAAAGEAVISPEHLDRLRAEDAAGKGNGHLTARELGILALMAEGLANQAIADRLFLSVNTVRKHAQTILEKVGAHSKLEAVTLARRAGIIKEQPQ